MSILVNVSYALKNNMYYMIVECTIYNIDEVNLVDNVQISDIFTNFLSSLKCTLIIQKRILKGTIMIVDLFIYFSLVLSVLFGIRHINISYCYTFLMH